MDCSHPQCSTADPRDARYSVPLGLPSPQKVLCVATEALSPGRIAASPSLLGYVRTFAVKCPVCTVDDFFLQHFLLATLDPATGLARGHLTSSCSLKHQSSSRHAATETYYWQREAVRRMWRWKPLFWWASRQRQPGCVGLARAPKPRFSWKRSKVKGRGKRAREKRDAQH